MSEPELTDEEKKAVRELLAKQNEPNAVVKFASKLPKFGDWIGTICGKYSAFLVKTGFVVWLLYVPINVMDGYNFYWPKIESAYNATVEYVHTLNINGEEIPTADPGGSFVAYDQSKKSYIVPTHFKKDQKITLVSSLGLPHDVIPGSGNFPSSAFDSGIG